MENGKNIPVVIPCGGMGARLTEYTEVRPRPLVGIGGRPIRWHIMKHYSHYGFKDFILFVWVIRVRGVKCQQAGDRAQRPQNGMTRERYFELLDKVK